MSPAKHMRIATEGGPYGSLGVLARDGELVQCHICGRWFRDLEGPHLTALHGMTATEYREVYGLNRKTALMGPARAATRGSIPLAKVVREGRRKIPTRLSSSSRSRRAEGILSHKRGWRNAVASHDQPHVGQ